MKINKKSKKNKQQKRGIYAATKDILVWFAEKFITS